MHYELWDVQTGNIINTYRTEAAALAVVRELLDANGQAYGEALALGRADDRGKTLVAEGNALVALALADDVGQPPRTA